MAGTRSDLGSFAARTAASIAGVLLIYWAGHWLESFRDSLASSFSLRGLWRWFVWAILLVLAGMAVSLAIRSRLPRGKFDWKTPVALGLVPLLLAMSYPMLVWGWPGSSVGSWLWSFRSEFTEPAAAGPAWILVGIAISAGWRRR